MGKVIINSCFVLAFFVLVEILLYIKDYNEVVVLSKYISYDIKSKNMSSFSNDKYVVDIKRGENEVRYYITYSRAYKKISKKYGREYANILFVENPKQILSINN